MPKTHLKTRIISHEDEWDAVREQWDALVSCSSYASTFLDFAWLRNWWRVFGATYGADRLRIVTAWHGSQLVGALPLYVSISGGLPRTRELRFVSTGEAEYEETCPDYLNLLCRPTEEAAFLESLGPVLHRIGWCHT